MKIAQVTPYFFPHVGGVESHVLSLSRMLIKKGYEVLIITSNYKNLKERENFEGLEIIRVKPFSILLTTPITPNIKKVLLNENYDVVHAHSPPPICSYYAASGCRETKKPFVLTYHCDLEIPYFFGDVITTFYRNTFGLYTVSAADRIIVTTKTYSATSRTVWRYEPVVIPNAVDTDIFNPSVDGQEIREKYDLTESQVVLFVGRLVPHKGLEQFVESALYVSPKVKYLIVGIGSFEENIKSRVQTLGLKDKVIFTGKVPNDALPKYYAACDLFVLPSVSRLEAFGIVALEAMASGKPVVVSDIPGVREVIADGVEGLLAEPLNARDIANKVELILSDEELRKRMGTNGRKKVEQAYSWEKVMTAIEKVYEEVVT